MSIAGVIGAFFLALLLTVVFSGSFRHRGPWGGLLLFGIIIFLAAWSAQIWITPVGPMAFGIAWMPFTTVAFLIAILLVATASSTGKINRKAEPATSGEAASLFAIGIFFWLLLIFFLFVIIAGYYIRPGTTVLAV